MDNLGMFEEIRYTIIPESQSRYSMTRHSAYDIFTGLYSKIEDTYAPGGTIEDWFNLSYMPKPKMWKSLKTCLNGAEKVSEKCGYVLWFTVCTVAENTKTGNIRMLNKRYGIIDDGKFELIGGNR